MKYRIKEIKKSGVTFYLAEVKIPTAFSKGRWESIGTITKDRDQAKADIELHKQENR